MKKKKTKKTKINNYNKHTMNLRKIVLSGVILISMATFAQKANLDLLKEFMKNQK